MAKFSSRGIMLTSRGFWLLVIDLAILLVATPAHQENVILLALAFLAWFAVEWLFFALRVYVVLPRLQLKRLVGGVPAKDVSLWAGRPATIRAEVHPTGWLRLANLKIVDRTPSRGQATGKHEATGVCSASRPLAVEYEYVSVSPGIARFEGLRLELSDLQGFFYFRGFLNQPIELHVLPSLVHEGNQPTIVKRTNALPPQGEHRFRRPGSGSELLDLREYIPGDPPKSIAWKVSARRDRLMTKEYESEAPVRCTLFVDVSDSVRVGSPGPAAIDRSAQIVAGLAQQLLATRDPVGLCLFDDKGSKMLPPAPGVRQLVRIHSQLASAVAAPLQPTECPASSLIEPAYAFCKEVYPHLLHPRVNRPEPWYRSLWSLMSPWSLAPLVMVGSSLAGIVLSVLSTNGYFRTSPWLLILLVLVAILVFLLLRRHPAFKRYSRSVESRGNRKQLSALLAAWHGLGPGGITLLSRDDREFSHYMQKLLIESQVAYPRPLYGKDGRYLFSSAEKIHLLSRLLLRSVAHCRDNELFVIVVEMLELSQSWPKLFESIKVALARHHQVIVICPWPAGLPLPTSKEWPDEELARTDPLHRRFQDPARALHMLDLVRYRRAYHDLIAQMGRLRVPVICASPAESVVYVLNRIEHLRAAHIRR